MEGGRNCDRRKSYDARVSPRFGLFGRGLIGDWNLNDIFHRRWSAGVNATHAQNVHDVAESTAQLGRIVSGELQSKMGSDGRRIRPYKLHPFRRGKLEIWAHIPCWDLRAYPTYRTEHGERGSETSLRRLDRPISIVSYVLFFNVCASVLTHRLKLVLSFNYATFNFRKDAPFPLYRSSDAEESAGGGVGGCYLWWEYPPAEEWGIRYFATPEFGGDGVAAPVSG